MALVPQNTPHFFTFSPRKICITAFSPSSLTSVFYPQWSPIKHWFKKHSNWLLSEIAVYWLLKNST